MFVTEKVVFIHMPKCAGDSVAQALKQKNKMIYYKDHASAWQIPAPFKTFRIIGFVRNPITWYQSFYFFMAKKIKQGAPVNINRSLLLSEDHKEIVSFDEYLERALHFDEHIKKFFGKKPYGFPMQCIQNLDVFKSKTFFEFTFSVFQMDKVEKYRIEDQKQKVLDILELDHLPRVNTTDWSQQSNTNNIYKKDQKYFELLGY